MTPDEGYPAVGRVRSLGLLKLVGGMLVCAALWWTGPLGLLEKLMDAPRSSLEGFLGQGLLVVMTIPVVLTLVGLWEAVSGRPFRMLESRWARLKEWQQGLFSFLLFSLAFGLLFLALQVWFGVFF